uniref:Uncharacterized protein n=1 Tax=Timema poppense TaxID=170557 RepID=A0A7R9D3N5_TIMPO|nr:unnamed protein product [Timema poppensis]
MKDQDVSFLVVEQALTGTDRNVSPTLALWNKLSQEQTEMNRPRCVTNSSIVEQALTGTDRDVSPTLALWNKLSQEQTEMCHQL